MAELVRIELSDEASARAAALPTSARARILAAAAAALEKEAESLARLIVSEVRKPLKDARQEVARAAENLRRAGEEARRMTGEILPLDLDAESEGRVALVRRVARGPALFITSFNFPLNLVAQKLAPAIAVGLPFILQPDPRAAATAERLLQIVIDAGWPAEAAVRARGAHSAVESLLGDDRLRLFFFSGSAAVGWKLKTMAKKAHVLMELESKAGVFVAADADLPWAAARCVWGAYSFAGQRGVSVKRIFVEKAAHSEFRKLLVQNIQALKIGDLLDEHTDFGPLIDEACATQVETELKSAMAGGAKLWAGGPRQGAFLPPTLIEGVASNSPLLDEEAFGPVAVLASVDSRERGLDALGPTRDGIQAGLFTNDLAFIRRAFNRLDVRALTINDVPNDSALRRLAIEDYTERRTMIIGGSGP